MWDYGLLPTIHITKTDQRVTEPEDIGIITKEEFKGDKDRGHIFNFNDYDPLKDDPARICVFTNFGLTKNHQVPIRRTYG